MLEVDRPKTAAELLAALPDIPHTGSYSQRDVGSLGVPCPIKRVGTTEKPSEEKKEEEGTEKQS